MSSVVGARCASTKWLGTGVLFVPTLIVATFAVGEGLGGEGGWWGHALQLLMVLALLVTAWRFPKVGGPALVLAGIGIGWWILFTMDEVWSAVITTLLVGAPMIVSGIFFAIAGYGNERAARRPQPMRHLSDR